MAEFRKEMAKLNHELEITKLNARIGSDEHNTIFGNDLWKNAKNNIDAAREALQNITRLSMILQIERCMKIFRKK